MTSQSEIKATGRRAARAAARRSVIVAAALDVFAHSGFAAARMEDVAVRAGVAKGTTYLYFPSKEALFEGILAEVVLPITESLRGLEPRAGETTGAFALRLVTTLDAGLRAGRGADVIRLLIAEGPRFPQLAESYYRSVIVVGLRTIREVAERAQRGGEEAEALARFPQLLVAPVLLGLIWESLFARFEPLDVPAMLAAQVELLLGSAEPTARPPGGSAPRRD